MNTPAIIEKNGTMKKGDPTLITVCNGRNANTEIIETTCVSENIISKEENNPLPPAFFVIRCTIPVNSKISTRAKPTDIKKLLKVGSLRNIIDGIPMNR